MDTWLQVSHLATWGRPQTTPTKMLISPRPRLLSLPGSVALRTPLSLPLPNLFLRNFFCEKERDLLVPKCRCRIRGQQTSDVTISE